MILNSRRVFIREQGNYYGAPKLNASLDVIIPLGWPVPHGYEFSGLNPL